MLENDYFVMLQCYNVHVLMTVTTRLTHAQLGIAISNLIISSQMRTHEVLVLTMFFMYEPIKILNFACYLKVGS